LQKHLDGVASVKYYTYALFFSWPKINKIVPHNSTVSCDLPFAPADQWKLAIRRGHGGRATLRSNDYATI